MSKVRKFEEILLEKNDFFPMFENSVPNELIESKDEVMLSSWKKVIILC